MDVGVNFIDTADAYGEGYAESSLGDWFAADGLRDKFALATQVLIHNFEDPEKRVPDTSYDYIIRECEASLKRLRTDRIEPLPDPRRGTRLRSRCRWRRRSRRLRKDGKVRWFG